MVLGKDNLYFLGGTFPPVFPTAKKSRETRPFTAETENFFVFRAENKKNGTVFHRTASFLQEIIHISANSLRFRRNAENFTLFL